MTPGRALAALLTAWAVVWPGSAIAGEPDLVVSTAVSVKEPLIAAIADFTGSPRGHRAAAVDIHAGGSSVLVQQILHGAPTDLFLSASRLDVDRLAAAELIAGTCLLGGNSLVVVVPPGGKKLDALRDLLDPRFERVGIANPRTAPLGRYTRQALDAANVDETLQGKRILAQHARQVVDYVARGEVDAAVIYATDATRFSDRVSVALEIDPNRHKPILYQAALLETGARRFRAEALFDFLCSDAGRARFAESGLTQWPGRR